MEQEKSRNSKLFIVLEIIILLLIVITLILSIHFYYNYKKLSLYNSNLKHTLSEICINKNNFMNKVKNRKQNFNELSEKVSKINLLKDEYYLNIRKLEEKILKGDSDKKIAYITIDDGPYNLTPKFLDILKEYNATATFFCLLKPSYIECYKRMVNEGHTIANHTASHNLKKSGIYSSTDTFVNDINYLNNWLYTNIGVKTTLFRFPGGSPTAGKNKLEIASKLKEQGYNYVDWNVIVGDGSDELIRQKRPYEWFEKQISNKKIALILMHDYSQKTLEDLPKILQYLHDNNYLILPLSNKSIMVS